MANYDLTYEGSEVQDILDTGKALEDAGFIFMGGCTPSTTPGTPTERVAYIGGAGTYNNFGTTVVVPSGSIVLFKYDGSSWSSQVINVSSNGYIYAGIAGPTTVPVTGNVFYVALTAGTYTNFDSLTVASGLTILKFNGSAWQQELIYTFETYPTQGSNGIASSGGTDTVIRSLTDIFTCSTAAATAAKTISTSYYVLRTGGCIKVTFTYANTADNATLQIGSADAKPLFYNGSRASSTNSWQAGQTVEVYYDGTNYQAHFFPVIDAVPTAGSKNLVESGGTYRFVSKFGVSYDATVNDYVKEIWFNVSTYKVTQIDFAIASYVSSGTHAGTYLNLFRIRTNDGNFTFIGPSYYASEELALQAWEENFTNGRILVLVDICFVAFSDRTFVPVNQVAIDVPDYKNGDIECYPMLQNYFQQKKIGNNESNISVINDGEIISESVVVTANNTAVRDIACIANYQYTVQAEFASALPNDTTIYVRHAQSGSTVNVSSFTIPKGEKSATFSFVAPITYDYYYLVFAEGSGVRVNYSVIVTKTNNLTKQNTLKVLLCGSSFGVNTISMFPVLAYHAGINITCGSLYYGSASIGLVSSRPLAHQPSKFALNTDYGWYKKFVNGAWESGTGTEGYRTFLNALLDEKWDIIIFQRGAEEIKLHSNMSLNWSDAQTSCLQQMIDYTRKYCGYEPEILFVDGLANPVGHSEQFGTQTRETQVQQTEKIVQTAQTMMSKFGISVIPVGVALQNARLTMLSQYGYHNGDTVNPGDMVCDGQHLDAGIGYYVTGATLFEYILNPRFGLTIMNLDYLPAKADVQNCWVQGGISGSYMFNGISSDNINIAKYAVLEAIKTPTTISTTIATRFPSLYSVTQNLIGCASCFQNDKCESVFFALITPDSGKTLGTPTITMGGTDVTSSAYTTVSSDGVTYGVVKIDAVTGDIIINLTAS